MRTKTQEEFLSLIRYELAGTPLPDGFAVSDEGSLLKLSEQQDVTHLVFDALQKNGIACRDQKFMSQYFAALWRVEQMDYELSRISSLFEENSIDFIPLKGAVIRDLYPQRWMRTSADIDILLRAEQEEAAEELLMKKLGYEQDKEHAGAHHASFYAPKNHVHIEPHRMLFHESHSDRAAGFFINVWDRALPDPDGSRHRFVLSDADLYTFHVAHMEKHFHQSGGCSVKGLIDLWLLNRISSADTDGRRRSLEKCGLTTFENKMRGLIDAWMDGRPAENELLEQYILAGYLYGSNERRAKIDTRKTGKIRYILGRVFMPIDLMKINYPVLEKRPYLLPFTWVARWTGIFNKKRRTRIKTQLSSSITADSSSLEKLQELSDYLGIQ